MSTTDDKIDELATMVAQGFTEMRGDMRDMREDITKLDGKVDRLKGDFEIMLDKFIGRFRANHDQLAHRVRAIEDSLR